MSRRIQRLNEQLKREITELLRTDVRDPRVGSATITAVEASKDLSYARIHVTALGGAERRDEILDGLNAASSYIRGELGRRLRVRRVPDLDFRWDTTLEHARRIERLIGEVRAERGGEPSVREPEPAGTQDGEEEGGGETGNGADERPAGGSRADRGR